MTKNTTNDTVARARTRIRSRAAQLTPPKVRRRKPADAVNAPPAVIEQMDVHETNASLPVASSEVVQPVAPAANLSSQPSRSTKSALVLKRLAKKGGISIASIMEATGWQAHSVRGFLSAVVRKKHGLTLLSDVGKDGVRRYRVETPVSA